MEKKLVALCVALFMTACLIFASCSNTASSSGGSTGGGTQPNSGDFMTEAEAIAAINALQSGGSITIKLGSSVKTISTDLQRALRDPNKKVTLDLSQSGVTSIGERAFQSCYSLTSVKIPSGVTSIGKQAFHGCYSLTSVEIPSGVTSIGDWAFNHCDSLTSVKIPGGVTSIGNSAFYECYSLTSVEIPDSVTSMGDYAFVRCNSLMSVKIPSGVTSISESAFNDCKSLTSVEIPSSVTSIGDSAFGRCDLLNKIKYTGTKNDWNTRITSFGTSWRSQYPTTVLAGVTCSDGKTYAFAEPNDTSSGTLSDTVIP